MGGEVGDGAAGKVGGTAEEIDAEGAVEGDFLLEVDSVGVGNAGDGCGGKDASGTEGGAAVRGSEEEGRLGGVTWRPVVDVGGVGDAVARGEFARGLEGFDEFVGF